MKTNVLLFTNNKLIIIGITLCTLLLFIIAGYGWHFYKEEIDLFYATSKINSLRGLLGCFSSGNVSGSAHPSNYTQPQLTFLTSFYRPLLFVIAFIQHSLLGMQPYAHYIVSICLHCFNIPLMYYLLSHFVNNVTAIVCTCLFALHPSFAPWLGNANMQQYTISATCIILVTLLLKKYLISSRKKFLISALLLFIFTLFIRETIIVAPAIIILLGLFKIIPTRKMFILTGLFTLATLPYLLAKMTLFPLLTTNAQATSFTNISAKTSLWFSQARTFLYDFLSISWLQGCPKIKALVVLMLLIVFFVLFFNNTKKHFFIVALGCMVLLLWPGMMVGYFIPSRFFYETTPAYIIAIALLIEYNAPRLRNFAYITVGLLVIGSSYYTAITLHERTKEPTIFYHAIMKLKNNPTLQNNPLCFFNLTNKLCWTGLAQQLWLYKINNGKPIFVLTETEEPFSNFPRNTIFITWDNAKNEFYVLPTATSNVTAVLTSQNERVA